jgi:hypothetical protein
MEPLRGHLDCLLGNFLSVDIWRDCHELLGSATTREDKHGSAYDKVSSHVLASSECDQ